jgi:putative glutathione S-transferase
MARTLLGLDQAISVSITHPVISEQGWRFGGAPGATDDHLFNETLLQNIYLRHDSNYTGMVSVPVLWDKQTDRMVNNESADILRMLNDGFVGQTTTDLAPAGLRPQIDRLNRHYYELLNNGVYRAGFATSQASYEAAVTDVFTGLEEIEQSLVDSPYILGDQFCETDIRLFVTLIRFDAAYHGLFKCNLKRVADYPQISAYIERIYRLPGVAQTVNIDHIKRGYYSLTHLNPTGIIPKGPLLQFG